MAQEVDEALRVIAMCGSLIVTLTRGSVFLVTQMLNLRKLLLYSKWEGKENYTRMMKQLRQNGDTAKILDINTQDTEIRDRITKMLADNHCLVANLPDLNSEDGHLQIQVAASQMSNVNLVLMKIAEDALDENHWAAGLKVTPIDEMRYMQTGTTIDGKARPEVKQLFDSVKGEDGKDMKIITEDDVIGHVVTYRTTGSTAKEITPQDLRDISREMQTLGADVTSKAVIVNMKPIDDDPVRTREGVANGKFFEISASENGSAGKVVYIPDEMLLKYQKAGSYGEYTSFVRIDLTKSDDSKIRIYDAELFEQLRRGDLTVDQLHMLTGKAHEGSAFENISSQQLGQILDAAGVIDTGMVTYSIEDERAKFILGDQIRAAKEGTKKETFTIKAMNGFSIEKDPGAMTIDDAIEASRRYSRRRALTMSDSEGRTVAVFVNGKIYSSSEKENVQRAIERMRKIGNKQQTMTR